MYVLLKHASQKEKCYYRTRYSYNKSEWGQVKKNIFGISDIYSKYKTIQFKTPSRQSIPFLNLSTMIIPIIDIRKRNKPGLQKAQSRKKRI